MNWIPAHIFDFEYAFYYGNKGDQDDNTISIADIVITENREVQLYKYKNKEGNNKPCHSFC